MGFNKHKTRRGKLEAKINTELSLPKPSIDKILIFVDGYEKDNLETIEKLKKNKVYDTKRINGALRSTITAHGPITMLLIGSATKRIHGALLDISSKPVEPPVKKRNLTWLMIEVTIWVGLVAYILKTIFS